MIAAVILAAGSSRRLGQPKQLVEVGGQTLVNRAVTTALSINLSPVIVVVNSAAFVDTLQAIGAQVLVNPRHLEGMSTSIQAGVQQAARIDASGVVIMACDQPAVTGPHLLALTADPESMSGSGYAGKIGIPAYFPAAKFGDLMHLQGDTGAREMLRHAKSVPAEDLRLDIDTPEDLQCARAIFG